MDRLFVGMGALVAMLGVAAGAFGAHALRGRLSEDLLTVFETAVRYQMYHAFALIVVGLVLTRAHSTLPTLAGWLFLAGIVLFSGSLYALSLSGVRWLGAITPIGGVAWLVAWLLLAYSALRA